MNTFRLHKSIYPILTPIIAAIASLYLAARASDLPYGYSYTFIIPLAFSILNFISTQIIARNKSLSIRLFNVISIARYVIQPTMIIGFGIYSYSPFYPPESTHIVRAIIYITFEMICLHMTIIAFAPRLTAPPLTQLTITPLPQNQVILPLVIILGAIFAFKFPEVLNTYRFFLSAVSPELSSSTDFASNGYGFVSLTINMAIVSSALWINSRIYSGTKCAKTNSRIIIGISAFIPLIIFASLTSRHSIIFPAFAAITLACLIYPRAQKLIILSLGSLLIAATTSMTVAKNMSHNSQNTNIHKFASLQSYLSPIYTVAQGINFLDNNIHLQHNLEIFKNDMISNLPVLSRFSDESRTSSWLYNHSCYGHGRYADQIIPLQIQCALHLGILLSPLYSCAFVILGLYLERRLSQNPSIENTFIVLLSLPKIVAISALGYITQDLGLLFTKLLIPAIVFKLNRIILARKVLSR